MQRKHRASSRLRPGVVAACLAAVGVLGLAAPASAAAPKRPSARCRDGSVSYATNARVACGGAGGGGGVTAGGGVGAASCFRRPTALGDLRVVRCPDGIRRLALPGGAGSR